jgi:hypothetical protein
MQAVSAHEPMGLIRSNHNGATFSIYTTGP